ncbi:MAG: hypothetical protein R3F24_02575 [Gammaproteobacteria bacterium]
MLTELLVPARGGAELGLLCPVLAQLTRSTAVVPPVASGTATGWVLLIAPPWIPYAPGLCAQGLALNRVLIVRVRQPLEMLWAMEEVLRSGACAGVIAWAGTTAIERMGRFLLQRLHLLACQQSIWAVLVRAAHCRRERSAARLRLQLQCPLPTTLQIEVFRNHRQPTGTITVERRF